MLDTPTGRPRSYELCTNVAGRTLHWRNRNHGVTLRDDSIAWTMDGDTNDVPFGNIVAVHLDSVGQKVTADRCTITVADGRGLTIVNTDPGGYADAAQAAAYRDFVRDLHARLATGGYGSAIRFTAGGPQWLYLTMLAAAIIGAPLFAAAGLAGYFVFHLWNGVLLLLAGEYFCWMLGRRALANRPRDYAAERLPEALLK